MGDLNQGLREVQHARQRSQSVEHFTALRGRHGVLLHVGDRAEHVPPAALERPTGHHFRVHGSAPFTTTDEKIAFRKSVLRDQIGDARVNHDFLNPKRVSAQGKPCA